MNKSLLLLFTRISTGLMLIYWAILKLQRPESYLGSGDGGGLSEGYYLGLLNSSVVLNGLAILQIAIGGLVIVGLMRKIIYPIQAVALGLGAAAVWRSIIDPMNFLTFIPGTGRLIFFPSLTVFLATLLLIAFMEDDKHSLDAVRSR